MTIPTDFSTTPRRALTPSSASNCSAQSSYYSGAGSSSTTVSGNTTPLRSAEEIDNLGLNLSSHLVEAFGKLGVVTPSAIVG